jgi:hypothetical protein
MDCFDGEPELRWDSVLQALANGAPCAATLTDLIMAVWRLDAAALRGFFQRFCSNVFPRLRTLELWEMDPVGNDLMSGLPQALLVLAQTVTPARLTMLEIMDTGWDFICAFTSVFEADGLPCLAELKLIVCEGRMPVATS